MKRTTALLAALSLVLTFVQPAAAQDAFNPDLLPHAENEGIYQIGEVGANEIASGIIATDRQGINQWTCESADDQDCADAKVSFIRGYGVLPPCESAVEENCIVSLELAAKDQEFQEATLERSTKGRIFSTLSRLNFFEQATPSLWDAPHAPSASGATKYVVIVRVSQSKQSNASKFETESFLASVVPYREIANQSCESPEYRTVTEDVVNGTGSRSIGLFGGNYEYAWAEDGACGVAQDFSEGTRVKLTVRLSSKIGGWFQGRIKNPTISISSVSKSNNEISVEAEPAIVQRMRYVAPDTKELTSNERKFASGGFAGNWDRFVVFMPASKPKAFEFLNYFKPKVADKSIGQNSFWNFGSSSGAFGGSTCLADKSKVLGIVTTNAMIYDGGVPKFSRGFISYRVAGLHYESDGKSEVIGSYDLIMRSEVARCLYGFSKAPISATITISGEGEKNIATTIVGERNGWLKLAAYGFTFSQKTIQVRLTQPKRITINCVSIKSQSKTTKVTGTNPKCPTGFKKR